MTSPSATPEHILVTGGAGYIGSLLTGLLLQDGHRVTVVDDLLFGGESLLAYWHHPGFRFLKGDVYEPDVLGKVFDSRDGRPDKVIHLAAIVGFPACQAVGRQVATRYNVEATKRVFGAAQAAGCARFLFSSTYRNYGLSQNGEAVTEESPLCPQSLYAETKIAAEEYLLDQKDSGKCAPTVFRFATLFGMSPRTRFDLIVNQFVLEALVKRELIIYQRGYARSFLHVRDVCRVICMTLSAPEHVVRGQVFNVGCDAGNYTKGEIVEMVGREVPGTEVVYKNLQFGGDMRDIRVSFRKIRETLGFIPTVSVEEGVREIRDAISKGLIKNPRDTRYRNAEFIVQ